MLQQAVDFRDESDALFALLEPLGDADLDRKTQFKDWTINGVLQHLHFWNRAADLSLTDEDAFSRMINDLVSNIKNVRAFEDQALDGLKGRKLLETWKDFYTEMSRRFENADPKKRLKWAGPDMSVRSSISARLMETWAHGQEVYDSLGVERINKDRIRNIAHLGISTFGWTYATRGRSAPADVPYVRLTAPSGDVWEWNDPNDTNYVTGDAAEFCQVVTQVRNIADTRLDVRGETATEWMSMAQCFAGPPETPPAPGTRFRRTP